ncbi:MAG: radical SAM protein [Infirmifilum sp.]|mgnify:CR=1 FL=1|uniref:radical SAM protein n=1 Tax=Infirmifilum TaxID=2856573 RepID=UPI00069C0E54|nr:radical SAM protein [Infirmifilum uzonense]
MNTQVLWVGGWKENSLVDVLESVSFTLWLSFCNFKCPWCANSVLARGVEKKPVSVDEIVAAASRAASFVDYFHVTGGEPTLQFRALGELFARVKAMTGLKLSLDTNASIPGAIEYILSRVALDHIAIDIKAPLEDPVKYARVAGLQPGVAVKMTERVRMGIQVSQRVEDFLELRTLLVPDLLGVEDVEKIAREILEMRLDKAPRLVYVVQQFIPYTGVPEEYRRKPKTPKEQVLEAAKRAKEILQGYAEIYYRTIEDGSRKL